MFSCFGFVLSVSSIGHVHQILHGVFLYKMFIPLLHTRVSKVSVEGRDHVLSANRIGTLKDATPKANP